MKVSVPSPSLSELPELMAQPVGVPPVVETVITEVPAAEFSSIFPDCPLGMEINRFSGSSASVAGEALSEARA